MVLSFSAGRIAGLAALILALQACGGGGGASTPQVVAASTAVAATNTLVATVTVSGAATFDYVPNRPTGSPAPGALNYAGTISKPVRGVTLQAISRADSSVLGSATSNDLGQYSLSVPSNTPFFVRMRAELVKTGSGATWNVAVKDNTQGDALYVLDGASQSGGTSNLVVNVHAASGWNGSGYNGQRAGGIAAILDTIYSGMKVVSAARPSSIFPPLTVFWSPLNTNVAGKDLATGEIGTSFFTTNTTGARVIYLLGKEGIDTDEYDSAVVAHEYGHYLQSAFSTEHSTGGSHGYPDKLDMTLAFSEGWGNAWSGISRGDPIYSDSLGAGQGTGFAFDLRLATPPTDVNRGWYREDAIDASLYQLSVSHGFAPIWTALTGPMKTTQDALATIFSFADAVRSAGQTSVTAAMDALLGAQNIFTGAAANQWGAGETNNGGEAANLPIYTALAFNIATPVCFSAANVTDGTANKLGSTRYFRITLVGAAQVGSRTITANFASGRDVDFDVVQDRKVVLRAVSTAPTSETGTAFLRAGEVIIRVLDFNTTAPPTSPVCATITIS